MTPDKVESRLGTLNFVDGVPTAETTKSLYDNLDYMRGVEVFLNSIPAASLEGLRLRAIEYGATKCNHALLFDQLMDSNPLYLTDNTDTVYCFAFLDLERDGPTVVEIPPKCGPGTRDDVYFRFVIDMGGPGPARPNGACASPSPRSFPPPTNPHRHRTERASRSSSRFGHTSGNHAPNHMKRFQEPLVHFALFGALIFAVSAWREGLTW